jgi:hypothetical protein
MDSAEEGQDKEHRPPKQKRKVLTSFVLSLISKRKQEGSQLT